MSRIAETFAQLRAAQRVAILPYVMIGYPYRTSSPDLVVALEAAGAHLFELGIPFSDPLADGATIQQAAEVSLANGVNVAFCIETVAQLRQRGVQAPLLLMGYYNPILRYGVEQACADLAAAGGDGWIVPDLPLEEAAELSQLAATYGLDLIMFVAPTTPDERIAQIAQVARGFLYCVSMTGVTGSRTELWPGLGAFLQRVRQQTSLPLVVGFGISTAAHVAQVGQVADGAIVGSALLRQLDGLAPTQVAPQGAAFLRKLQATSET